MGCLPGQTGTASYPGQGEGSITLPSPFNEGNHMRMLIIIGGLVVVVLIALGIQWLMENVRITTGNKRKRK